MQSNQEKSQSWNKLQLAVMTNDLDTLANMLIKPDKKTIAAITTPASEGSKVGWNALHIAACLGHSAAFAMLMQALAKAHYCFDPVTEGSEKGFNCLHLAAASGHQKIIDIIIRFVNKKESNKLSSYLLSKIQHGKFKNWQALHLAAQWNHPAVTKSLLLPLSSDQKLVTILEHLDKNSYRESYTALHIACLNGSANVVQEMLTLIDKENISMLIQDSAFKNDSRDILNAFHFATLHGRTEIIALILKILSRDDSIKLITEDIVVYYGENMGKNALHIASREGHFSIVNLFIKILGEHAKTVINTFLPNPGNDAGLSNAIVLAGKRNHRAVVYLLAQHGGSAEIPKEEFKRLREPYIKETPASYQTFDVYLNKLGDINQAIAVIVAEIKERLNPLIHILVLSFKNIPLDVKIQICIYILKNEFNDFPVNYLYQLIQEKLTSYQFKTHHIISTLTTQKNRDRFLKIDDQAATNSQTLTKEKIKFISDLIQSYCKHQPNINFDRQNALQLIENIADSDFSQDGITTAIVNHFNGTSKKTSILQISSESVSATTPKIENVLSTIATKALQLYSANLAPANPFFASAKIVIKDKARLVIQCLKQYLQNNPDIKISELASKELSLNLSKTSFLEKQIMDVIQQTLTQTQSSGAELNQNNKRNFPDNKEEEDTANKKQKTI